jgi:hypothetical protein
MMIKTISFLLLVALWLPMRSETQNVPASPILAFIESRGLATPRSKWEQKTHADINGTSCAATKWTDVGIESHGIHKFTLSYNISVDIEDYRDACLEGDVPEIDTQFELTFADSENSRSIDFKGEVPVDCKKCKPKRGRTISGTLSRLSERNYRLSFSGDLSDTVDLEPSRE